MNCTAAGCPPIPPYPAVVFHCQNCHASFAALGTFDAHQDRPDGWGGALACRPPASLGLVPDHNNVWKTPEGLILGRRRAEWLSAARRPPRGAGAGGPAATDPGREPAPPARQDPRAGQPLTIAYSYPGPDPG